MLGLFKKMFGVKTAETAAEVPYKVETPVVQTPTAVEVITQDTVESVTPAKKAPAKKPATTSKPRRPKSKTQ